ncbi:VPLPA-CTERM sorting domain-containing protein [Sneathiella glossodoripedis]|uniref:VPLPA-CTERM sorting domain-containing protein n=1 Tax=Sneathiella glossodoripedis TaxID=418853 RepID=UPI0004708169|nr:VPLPA-CTERM sorting domain-containing protein [Sneathiella glossodoripedis]
MIRISGLLIAIVAAFLTVAGSANAATMWFTSGNGTAGANSYSFTVDGVTAVATPMGRSNGGQTIHQYSTGLGVYSSDCNYSCSTDSDHQVDGYMYGEAVRLRFSEPVLLTSILFSYVGWNDDFKYRVDRQSWSARLDIPNDSSYEFAGDGILGQVFRIGAFDYNDEWKLRGVSFSTISAVPLPPALLMFGAALAGLALFRRGKKAL